MTTFKSGVTTKSRQPKPKAEKDVVLCNDCKIFEICHEPMKGFVEESCEHFKGEAPEDFIYYNSCWRRLHRQRWRDYIGYVFIDNKRVWLYNFEVDGEEASQ